MGSEKSYLEIKITFIHIVVMLVAIVLLGVFLFFLGYKAGKSSITNQLASAGIDTTPLNQEKIQIVSQKGEKKERTGSEASTIKEEEIKFHQQASKAQSKTDSSKSKTKLTPKKIERQYYFTVQTGSFENHAEARSYSTQFTRLHYPTEVKRVTVKNKTMYRVLVGQFSTREEAVKEIKKLELIAKKKGFFVQNLR